MGEPLQVLESSDSEISRLFPKCRPRFVLSNPSSTTDTDLNLNRVRDSNDNDNYKLREEQTVQPTYDEEVTSQDSSVSRMSVDTVSATSSSSNASNSSVSSPSNRSGQNGKIDQSNDLITTTAYRNYEETQPSILNSSYEDTRPNHRHCLTENTAQPLPSIRRDHNRLRDSRIEAAGGREVFSQSRSRQIRRRHDETRKTHPSHHHHYHHHLNHHSSHHHPQAAPRRHQIPVSDRRETSSSRSETSSSRSASTNSSLGDQTSEGATGPSNENKIESSMVLEPCLTANNEVVFDDINEWVTRGLSVRGMLEDRTDKLQECDSCSHSEHETDSDQNADPVKKIGNVPIAEYEGSPRRYGPRGQNRHHSPRSVHLMPQVQRTPKPGFPRRVTSNEERRNSLSVSSTSPMWDKPTRSTRKHDSKERAHHREKRCSSSRDRHVDFHKEKNFSKDSASSKLSEECLSKLSNYSACLDPSLVKEPIVCKSFQANHSIEQENEFTHVEQDKSQEVPEEQRRNLVSPGSLPVISISTLSSLYGPVPDKSEGSSRQSNKQEVLDSEVPGNDYDFEISETRKVLQDFFRDVEPKLSKQKFSDLEYTLKRQQGNSYVGQRLAEDLKELAEGDLQEETINEIDSTFNGMERHTLEGNENSQDDNEVRKSPFHRQYPSNYSPIQQLTTRSSCSSLSCFEMTGSKNSVEDTMIPPSYSECVSLSSAPACWDSKSPVHGQFDSGHNSEVNHITNDEVISIVHDDSNLIDANTQTLVDTVANDEVELLNISEHFLDISQNTYETSNTHDTIEVNESLLTSQAEKWIQTSPLDLVSGPIGGDSFTGCPPWEEEYPETHTGVQVGTSRNFTLSPASTSCDSAGAESEYSGDVEGSVHSSLRGLCATMPVLEDGLSSGEESDSGVMTSQRNGQIPERSFVSQYIEDLAQNNSELVKITTKEREDLRLYQQRTRSFDDQLCRGELPSFRHSHGFNIDCQPKINSEEIQRTLNSSYERNSPSSSTLTLMKKQITEIEREIAMKKPEGNNKKTEQETTSLDLHLLDPLSEKLCEPPPPPAPHPHRDGDPSSPSSKAATILHSPQSTPVSCGLPGPQLLSSMGTLSSPISTFPPLHQEQPKTGSSVSPSRESVEAAIADIKQAIRRTKSMSLKVHPQERHADRGPVWIPRSRRDVHHSERSTPTSPQQGLPHHLSPDHDSSPSVDSTRSRERSLHEGKGYQSHSAYNTIDDGDTDQETDRLLGQQRSDETGFIEEKSWRRAKKKPVMPRYLSPKDNRSGDATPENSNDSTQSTPIMQSHVRSPGQSPPSPQDNSKTKPKKDKETNKKKGRSKEVMIHEPAVLIEGVLFRARYLGSTQLVSEGQPTKTTRMMQAEEAVSRIKEVQDSDSDDFVPKRNLCARKRSPSPTSTSDSTPSHPIYPSSRDTSLSESEQLLVSGNSRYPPYLNKDVSCSYSENLTVNVTSQTSDESAIIDEDSTNVHYPNLIPNESNIQDDKSSDAQLLRELESSRPVPGIRRVHSDENLYVNVASFPYTLNASVQDQDAESESERETDKSSWNDNRTKNGQGNVAWIVDGGGGVGPTGTVFHLKFVCSMEVTEEDNSDRKTKKPRKEMVMEAVARLKAPEGEPQPSTEVDLFISTEKIMVLNTDLKEIMMDHALRTISYIADIGDLVVLMARRRVLPTDEPGPDGIHKTPKMICHVFESDEAQFIAQSIGQAFQVAYLEFLKANGIEDHSFVKEMDYQEVLNSQEIFGDELQMFAKKELQKEVVVPKLKGDILGVVVVESGWGSMVPTVVIANLSPVGAAAKCGQLNIGDQIIAINGVSLVGLPLSTCQNYIKNTKYNTAVKLTVVPCPPVVEVKIRRPDTKYQLGFSVQNGVICSLLRGGIAERGGVRVGHRIIDINSQSVVAVPHEKIVNLLATSVGEIRMKTMPTSIFRLLTGQETPQYI